MSEQQEDVRRQINESANPIKLTTKIKRGTGTRDQDVIKVDVSGDDPVKTVAELNKVLEELEGTEQTLRSTQPEEPNE